MPNLKEKNISKIGKLIIENLEANNPEGVIQILAQYLDNVNKVQSAQDLKISRSGLYKAIGPNGNPTIKTLAKILSTNIKNRAR